MGYFEDLANGLFFDSMINPVTSIIGSELFYVILWAGVLSVLFAKTRRLGTVIVGIMVSAPFFTPLILGGGLAGLQSWFAIIVIAGITYLIWDVIFRG